MNVSDYLEHKIILPPGHWQYPLRFGFLNEAPLAKTSRADITAGIAPDAAVEFVFPEFPSLC